MIAKKILFLNKIVYRLMFKYLITFLIIQASLSQLTVYGPQCAVAKVKNINYTLSNFGEIPYGQTIIGKIRLPKNEHLCEMVNQVGVTETETKDTNTKDVLLVQRGVCKFTQKVINAQSLGADIIIIYDNQQSDSPKVIMKNDGHGHLAEIPSIFISKKDGMNLVAALKQCTAGAPLVKILFEIDQKETSQVTLWLDSNNRETYILARDFYKNGYYNIIKDRVQFTIRFRVENGCEDWICKKQDCVVANVLQKYCKNVIRPEITAGAKYPTGKELIQQQLREYFLWEQLKSTDQKLKWWRYMTKFDHQICLDKEDVADCSYNQMKAVQISQSMIKNVKKNVEQTYTNLTENKQNILKRSYQESNGLQIIFYPQATINNRNFFGLFKAPEVFETICNSLIDPPSGCVRFIKQNHQTRFQEQEQGPWKTVLIILAIMTLCFLGALFIYTRIIRKEVNQQLSVEVNKMVENYVNLATKKNTSTPNSYSKFES